MCESKSWLILGELTIPGACESVADVDERGVSVPLLTVSFVFVVGGMTDAILSSTLHDPSASVVYLQNIGSWYDIAFCLRIGESDSNEDCCVC